MNDEWWMMHHPFIKFTFYYVSIFSSFAILEFIFGDQNYLLENYEIALLSRSKNFKRNSMGTIRLNFGFIRVSNKIKFIQCLNACGFCVKYIQ